MENKNEKNKGGNRLRLPVILLAAALICLALYLHFFLMDRKMREQQETVTENVLSMREGGTEQASVAESTLTREEEKAKSEEEPAPVKEEVREHYPEVTAAQTENPDIIGLLEYGPDSMFYVVQGVDNDFYLDHDYLGESAVGGAAMLDVRSLLNPRSVTWIIHGHNMKNETMFGNLRHFRETDFVKDNPVLTLTLPDEKQYYAIFAVLDVNVDEGEEGYFKITEFDFEDEEAYNAYTSYYIDHSYFELPVDTGWGDDLLILSTCSYGYSNGRLLIVSRRLREGETPDGIKKIFAESAVKK